MVCSKVALNNVQQDEPQRSTLPSLYRPNGQTSYTSNAFKQSSLQVPEREEPIERDDYNLRFKRSYTDLAQKISSRYPSSPRRREGAIGGTWRHVREVLGHGGSMLCYIDGMVSIHDNEALQASLTKRPLHPPYAPLREDFENRTQDCIFPRVDSDLERKLKLASMPKRKGHYRF
ncbi:uncharacterized protein LOC131952138 [Physella acuta]|uniref:uncharacterized protein LOC131952138 n=1 Tax=Physella acuta TaxID=109671 RepID=UPI0027DD8DFC|nr:uncharacterized protein LOC131952138 [Physella acuta]